MTTIQWRPTVNALTTPSSYRMLFLPRNVVDSEELAARIAAALPNYSADEIRTILAARNQIVRQSLTNGEQVTEENNFTYSLSFTGRLDEPDEPPPEIDECLQVRIHASPPFVDEVRHAARLERLAREKKLPLINTVEDTLLRLDNVLNPNGVLRLSGEDLYFDQEQETSRCVIEGTESGRTVQKRLNLVTNTAVMLMPDIPAQTHPWNNEYTVSVTTHYSSHGTPRTGMYERMLRTPLAVSIPGGKKSSTNVGILTDNAEAPYVSITGGTASADEGLRIQVIQNLAEEELLFSLLAMKEEGTAGDEVSVTTNGARTLTGFSGSGVRSLQVKVNDYAALWEMIRNDYGGRLVDILDIVDTDGMKGSGAKG